MIQAKIELLIAAAIRSGQFTDADLAEIAEGLEKTGNPLFAVEIVEKAKEIEPRAIYDCPKCGGLYIEQKFRLINNAPIYLSNPEDFKGMPKLIE